MWTRWIRFNVVGMAGTAVQLCALWIATQRMGVPYVAATVLAVEIAILHNFVWHEAWTWRGMPLEDRGRRLFRFHVGNGLVSIVFNALFTWMFREWLGLPVLVANLAAVAVAALINFTIAHAWVFREE